MRMMLDKSVEQKVLEEELTFKVQGKYSALTQHLGSGQMTIAEQWGCVGCVAGPAFLQQRSSQHRQGWGAAVSQRGND